MNIDLPLDFAQTYSDIIAYIGFIGALVGWLYQWKKNRDSRKQELRSIWDNISVIKAAMSEIESAESKCRSGELETCSDLPHEIHQAHTQLADLFRNTLTRVISREGKVTLITIKKWRKSGKLSSDWQQKCAMTILLTEELTNKELNDLDEKYSTWDAIDNVKSPLGSKNPSDTAAEKHTKSKDKT